MKKEYEEISVSIPTRLRGELDLRFYDPAMGRSEYGARSRLIVKLLEEWLKEEKDIARDQRDRLELERGVEGVTERGGLNRVTAAS